jgi:hypothetical protein
MEAVSSSLGRQPHLLEYTISYHGTALSSFLFETFVPEDKGKRNPVPYFANLLILEKVISCRDQPYHIFFCVYYQMRHTDFSATVSGQFLAIAQAVTRQILTAAARARSKFMWDLWCTKWHWGWFPPSTSVSIANSHSTNCPTLIIVYHRGLVR